MTTLLLLQEYLDTPLGRMLLVSDRQDRLRAVDWLDYQARMHLLMARQYKGCSVELEERATPSRASLAMQAYFAGDLPALDELAVETGGTAFQREVWTALRGIPHGQTLSYRELASRIGRPAAVRAVGLANGANPISLVLPCHRVIGSNASLTGYGGGLHRKQWLLEHERAWLDRQGLPGQAQIPGL